MPLVVGVSFKKAGKIYYFDPSDIELHENDYVIAETARGIEFGQVMIEPKEVQEHEIVQPLKRIVRKASTADVEREESNKRKEKTAYTICQQKIQLHNLPMKLINAEYCFDSSQVTFFFSAEARVDFRELVKDLAGALRTKVQLHQVGVRDEAKIFGGMGPCGRGLCCATFMNGFEPVSMRMAKEQSLFLNPLKFSGICGKLMCCLKYEHSIYKEVKGRLPSVGSFVDTPSGSGKVVEVNVIRESLNVQMEDGSILHILAADLGGPSPCCMADGGECASCAGHAKKAEPEASEPKDSPEGRKAEPDRAPANRVTVSFVSRAPGRKQNAEQKPDAEEKPKPSRRPHRGPKRPLDAIETPAAPPAEEKPAKPEKPTKSAEVPGRPRRRRRRRPGGGQSKPGGEDGASASS
jgi:cell fate regulator YaaT (PSP1 superfamily)